MEKKTIGKFIAVLRKANGMTQRELGDKLFVSDKTVSRWERDECSPELSLIPAIAEIFGITTDELLRGERNSSESATQSEETQNKPSAKSEKQFKAMLHSRMKKYKNLSLISVGLLIVGLIAAVICNVVFWEAILGFWVSVLFIVAGTICQLLFVSNARIPIDEEDDSYTERINEANSSITKIAIGFFYGMIALFTFCMQLVFADRRLASITNGIRTYHYMLDPEQWAIMGLVFVLLVLAVCRLIHLLFIKPVLIKRGLIFVTDQSAKTVKFRRKILGKVTCIGGIILVILIAAVIVIYAIGVDGLVKKEVYDTLEDFRNAMLEDQEEFIELHRNFHYLDKDGNKVYTNADLADDYMLEHAEVTDFGGNVIFEYDYNATLYHDIQFSNHSDRTPVTVITDQALFDAQWLGETILIWLFIFMGIDLVTCTIAYFSIAYGKKSKKI